MEGLGSYGDDLGKPSFWQGFRKEDVDIPSSEWLFQPLGFRGLGVWGLEVCSDPHEKLRRADKKM